MPTPYPKTNRISTSFKVSKPSSKIFDHTPAIEKLQQENAQLLQQLEERKTMDIHLHHDNAILQEKVNSLQRLVHQMTNDNHSLCVQLKHRKRVKTKSSRQEASKANPSLAQQV
jgi:arginine deiminase